MEILTAGSDRRNILVLLDESAEEARDFIQRLELDFGVTRTTDVDSCLKTMAERFVDL